MADWERAPLSLPSYYQKEAVLGGCSSNSCLRQTCNSPEGFKFFGTIFYIKSITF